MSIDEVIEALVRLGNEEINFDVGPGESVEAWNRAQERIGGTVPGSWLRFVSAFGNGTVVLDEPWQTGLEGAGSVDDHPYFEANSSCRRTRLGFHVAGTAQVGPLQAWVHDDKAEDWGGWCVIGSAGDGDQLLIRTHPRSAATPADAEVAWYDHEAGGLTYRWPSVLTFLEYLLTLHGRSKPVALGNRLRESKATAPPLMARSDTQGWVKCPQCGWRFSVDDRDQWNGRLHAHCGQRVLIEPQKPA